MSDSVTLGLQLARLLVYGILQGRIQEWVGVSSSRGSSWLTQGSNPGLLLLTCIGRQVFFTTSATWEVPKHSCWTQNSIWFCLEAPSDFPGGSDGKESAHNARDLGSTPGLRRSLKGEHGNPLQHSCWRIPMDREAWLATVYGVTKSQTWLSD